MLNMLAANTIKMFKDRTALKLVNKFFPNSRNLSVCVIRKLNVGFPIKNDWVKYFKRRQLLDHPDLRCYSTVVQEELIDSTTFERVCEDTLDLLAEYFEELIESEPELEKGDIVYGAGVLTLDLGKHGTYVINRQSPNRQIWLSSPISGPKRYDFSIKEDCWIYKHDGKTLHSLLEKEFSNIIRKNVKIPKCGSA